MAETRPDREYSPQPSTIEQWAGRYLKYRNRRSDMPRQACHPGDIEGIKQAFHRSVAMATLAGIVSGGAIGGMEWYMRQGMLDGMQGMTLKEQLPYWTGFFAVAGVVSAVEIAFLYWNALRGVATISERARAPLHGSAHARLTLLGLSRVALEFPSPRHRIYGIDPYARMSRWKLTAMAVMYRMKVGVSSFMLRILLRRVLGRVALRGLLPLVTGPLYALWNAIITWRIMGKAREQALGPFAIEAMVEPLRHSPLSERAQRVVLHALGALIMANQDAHPNHVYLLSCLLDVFDTSEQSIDVDWPQQRFVLNRLERHEKYRVLELLAAATVMAGRCKGKRKRFLEELYDACNLAYPDQKARTWRRRFMEGKPIVETALHPANQNSPS
ncbi:LBF_2804 family protein [Billgrantia sp. LNSP4103-1]|uniref:LBF_2804 family protein n=1 Tax=Billgrantia sp. LNSP4103-1 TaxID=3410266 RepID=UPI00403F4B46